MQLISFCTMVILVILGTWIVYGERHLIRKGLASYSWKAAEGVIVDSFDETFVTAGVDRNNAGIVPVSYKQTGTLTNTRLTGAFISRTRIVLGPTRNKRAPPLPSERR